MCVANVRTLTPGVSGRFWTARYHGHSYARWPPAVNLDEVVSGYACLSRLGQKGYCVSFYRIPTVERQRPWIMHRIGQRQWIMRRIGQREWIMHIQHPLMEDYSDPQRRTAQ